MGETYSRFSITGTPIPSEFAALFGAQRFCTPPREQVLSAFVGSALEGKKNVAQTARAEYEGLIGTIYHRASAAGLDPVLVLSLIKQESNFNPSAQTTKGALGLGQIMPSTGRDLGVLNSKDLLKPDINIDATITYLSRLLRANSGNYENALAAYNAGQGRVNQYGGIPPFKETRDYVRKIMASYAAVSQGAASAPMCS